MVQSIKRQCLKNMLAVRVRIQHFTFSLKNFPGTRPLDLLLCVWLEGILYPVLSFKRKISSQKASKHILRSTLYKKFGYPALFIRVCSILPKPPSYSRDSLAAFVTFSHQPGQGVALLKISDYDSSLRRV